MVPLSLGGTNKNPIYEDLKKATELCYKICYKKIIELTNEKLSVENKNCIFIVAKNINDQYFLSDHFNVRKFLIEKDNSIFLTDKSVEDGNEKDYKVVITTSKNSEGYTLTRSDTMITSVYPSNNATREQLEGRINRIGSNYKTVYYYIVHTGILTYILHNHNNAKSLSVALKAIVNSK